MATDSKKDMTQNHNVVDLDKLRAIPEGGASKSSLPAPLSKVRDLAVTQLKTLLRLLFDNADDALFELADKAGSNGEQAKYFDAMREVRLQRKQVAVLMLQSVVRSFNQVGRYKLKNLTADDKPTSLESLSLVQNDELEERVAIDGMVSKTRSACGQSVDHYQIRIESLLPNTELDQAHIPASPEVIVHSFVDGCKDLQVDIESKLIVLKLFEKYVLNGVAEFYQKANQQLISDGVMPDLKQVRANERRTATRTPPTAQAESARSSASSQLVDGETGEVISEEGGLFESLRQMLHAQSDAPQTRSGYTGNGSGVGHPNAAGMTGGAGAGGFTEVSRDQVVSVLSNVQHDLPQFQSSQNDVGLMNFRALLAEQMSVSGIESPSFKKVDDDVINLVSMLFEFILDDRQLQPTMKALISRLQIPMLKVAMLDRSFFNKGGHPARKLLNEIATAAIGWNEKPEGQRDPLKDKVESIVQALLENFDSNLDVFDSLLSEFTRFLDVESRRGQLIEQRTRDAEEGMARNESAKGTVQQSIDRIIGNKTLPESAQTLLEDGWGQYMSLTYLKHGDQSEAWNHALTVAENLVWSVCPDIDKPDARSHLLSMIPGLLKSIRAGLSEASYDQFKSGELLRSLEGLHIDALQMLANSSPAEVLPEQNEAESIETKAFVPEQKKTVSVTPDIIDEGLINEVDAAINISTPVDALSSDQTTGDTESANRQTKIESQMDTLLDDVDSILDDVDAAGHEATSAESIHAHASDAIITNDSVELPHSTSTETADPATIEMVESLRVGSWLEFHEDGKVVRCKLAALIRVTGKYIFVDRSGIKVADKNKAELLTMAQQGLISMLNDGLLFDRALESVIGNLRNNRND